MQISNFREILDFKKSNPDKVILLRGNHLNQHTYDDECFECSQYFPNVAEFCHSIKDDIVKLTQWIYVDEQNKIVYSHAGISKIWMERNNIDDLNEINKINPEGDFGHIFGFDLTDPFDMSGESIFQGPEWIRPQSLIYCNIDGYTQVVGHSTVKNITDIQQYTHNKEHIWLCDNFPDEYLVIRDNEFEIIDNSY